MFRGTSQHSHTRSCSIYGGFQRSWYGADANPDGVADAFMFGVCFKGAKISLKPHNCRVIQALTFVELKCHRRLPASCFSDVLFPAFSRYHLFTVLNFS